MKHQNFFSNDPNTDLKSKTLVWWMGLLNFSLLTACFNKNPEPHSTPKAEVYGEVFAEVQPLERQNLIREAKVFDPAASGGPSCKNMGLGPADPFFNKELNEFSCLFKKPDPLDPPGGRTPKFECQLLNKDGSPMVDAQGKPRTVKVKYDPAFVSIDGKNGKSNEEVYGEVLSTRLLWAIGFGADRTYPARVTCIDCPIDPWTYIRKVTKILDSQDFLVGFIRRELFTNDRYLQTLPSSVFELATVEVKHPSKSIKAPEGVLGWSWGEMYQFSKPEQKVERDMLTLFAAFIDHMDNKASQQRLTCLTGKGTADCPHPFLMVQDAGSAFGNGWAPFQGDIRLNKMDLDKWLQLSVWRNMKSCLAQVHGAPNASFRTTWQVSDKAREQLGRLLSQITDDQLRTLFRTARVDKMKKPTPSSVESWVRGFKAKLKRDLIDARCEGP